MKLIRWVWIVAIALLAWALTLNPFRVAQAARQEGPGEQAAPVSPTARTPPDLEDGKRQFDQNCSSCHGVDAGGQEAPDLHGVPARLGDATVQGIIRRGIPGTAMPGFSTVTDKQAADIVAYLRTLSGTGAEKATGDPQKGEAIYNSSGCSTCHMIDGQGGSIGPELSRIGAMRGPTNLKARLLDPGANLPQVGGGIFGNSLTQYLMFRAVEKDGHAIEGIRMSEDSFTIVLKDAGGKFHGLWKPDLRSLEKEPGRSFMPSFKGTLSDVQLDDLVAYLMSLKSGQ